MKRYGRYSGETLVNVARLKLLGIGKYAFETSLFNEKPYELNMNMPLFDTEAQAHKWIESTDKWQLIAECGIEDVDSDRYHLVAEANGVRFFAPTDDEEMEELWAEREEIK